jgi:nucleoside-triphosphatase
MSDKGSKILLTGLPGCGKTTAIKKIVANLNRTKVAGFYTQEIRQNDTRKGFSWNRLDGPHGILAHVNIKERFKVGKYGVDVDGFEKEVVPILDVERTDAELFVIDEIGKMECFSEKFVAAVERLFASDKSVLATIAKKGTGFIREVKNSPNIKQLTLTRDNREKIISEISKHLSFLRP